MKKKFYCSYCGAKMLCQDVGAENYCPITSMGYYTYSKFNSDTGKRLYIKEYTCPKYRTFLGMANEHSQFSSGKLFSKRDRLNNE